jgi:hypothetical protein
MTKAKLTRMASGHWLATFKTDGVITGTRVVGAPSDTWDTVVAHLRDNFGVAQIVGSSL